MAATATDSLVHVNAVVEVNEVRKIMHADPLQVFSGAEAFTDRFQHGRIGPDLRVAVHAGASGRNAGEIRGLHRSVAIAAIDAQAADVVLMAEGRILDDGFACAGDISGALQ